MSKRQAKKHALRCASRILETNLSSGWPYDGEWTNEEADKVAEAMQQIVDELDRRGEQGGSSDE